MLTNTSLSPKITIPCPEEDISTSGTNFSIPKAISDRIVLSMENVVVGRFLSFRPTVDMVKRWALTKWNLKGSVEVCTILGGIFLFKFTTMEDLISILSSRP